MRKKFFIIIAVMFLAFCGTQKTNATSNLAGKLVITAVNTGSTGNAGEMVQISKLSDESISLAGVSLVYEKSIESSPTLLYEFKEGDEMVGESLLIRYVSKTAEEAGTYAGTFDVSYSTNILAGDGGVLKIMFNNDKVDSICWGAMSGCNATAGRKFNGGKETLVRNLENLSEVSFVENYVPAYDPGNPGLMRAEVEPQCRGLRFSEILTYYETSKSEQFIEFVNDNDEQMLLDGCVVRYKNKNYPLSGVVGAGNFYVRYVNDFTLTKNPSSQNTIELIDINNEVVDTLVYYNGQKKGVSYAQIGYKNGKEQWVQTYNVTPGEENTYQQWKTCPEGKVINEETGNCVKDTTIDKTLEACPAGKYRNPLTGRCKSYATSASSGLKPCAEGYERNPETNRCRKITTNTGAGFALAEEIYDEKSNFVAIWAIVGVLAVGAGYVAFQYRKEIAGIFRKKK